MKSLLVLLALAAPSSPWTISDRAAFAAGRLDGVALDPDGRLVLGGKIEEVARFEAKYAWDVAAAANGSWIVACGEPASVYRVTGTKRETIWEGAGAEVYAVHAARDGSIWWGVAPLGTVYRRTPRGETEVYVLSDSYVWAFAETPEGVFAATGSARSETGGAVVHLSGGRAREVVRLAEPHILALVAQGSTLYGGTSGQGYLFSMTSGGADFRILYDPEADEIQSLAAAPEGIYLLLPPGEKNALSGAQAASLSLVLNIVVSGASEDEGGLSGDSTAAAPASSVAGPTGLAEILAGLESTAVAVPAAPRPAPRRPVPPPGMMMPGMPGMTIPGMPSAPTPPRRAGMTPGLPGMPRPGGAQAAGGAGGRIHLYRADGVVAPQYELDTPVREIIFSREGLLFAEIEGGGVYRLESAGRARLVARPEIDGVLAVAAGAGGEAVFVSKSSPTLFRLAGTAPEGTFRSSVFDAGAPARWGVLDFDGAGRVYARIRTGMVAEPGLGWSGWTPEIATPYTAIESGRGRFAQVEIRLVSDATGAPPEVARVSASFEALNHPPRISSARARPLLEYAAEGPQNVGKLGAVGAYLQQVLQAGNRPGRAPQQAPPPGLAPEDLLAPVRNFWVVAWEAADPDEDDLSFRVVLLSEDAAVGRTVAEDLEEPTAILNGRMLPEGRYRVRIEASDAPGRAPAAGETVVFVSGPFTIDNTPPAFERTSARREDGSIVVEGIVRDARGAIAGIEYVLDEGEWTPLAPTDGIADAPDESFLLRVGAGPGPHLILLRAEDESGNLGIVRIPIASKAAI